jgi:hypothetical protein
MQACKHKTIQREASASQKAISGELSVPGDHRDSIGD